MEAKDFLTRVPGSTYRLQLHKDFGFVQAKEILGYLRELGVSDVYLSSYLKARRGSLHGYDIVDFNRINDEIGSDEDYEDLVKEQRWLGMGQLFDLVPNHMCIVSADNAWWMDVLENGPSSIYAHFFDINWEPVKPELKNRVLVPILGDQYGKVLEEQELQLGFERGAFFINYWDNRFPIMPDTYNEILSLNLDDLKELLSSEHPSYTELLSIITGFTHLPGYTERDPEKTIERNREKEILKKRIAHLYDSDKEIARFINGNLTAINGKKGRPASFDLLDSLLGMQAYRLSYWRVAGEEINYRRFFDINELAAIRMEDDTVFEATHKLVFELIRRGNITGLRIDHPDGLYDPSCYFRCLQEGCFVQEKLRERGAFNGKGTAGAEQTLKEKIKNEFTSLSSAGDFRPFYVVGEKILMKNEPMPEEWPIFSTTGYTFMNLLNGIFVDMSNAASFDRIYRWFTKAKSVPAFGRIAYEKKKLIMKRAMSSEVNTLGHYLNRISERNRHTRDFTLNSLINAIAEVIAFFPVYRTYVNGWDITARDRQNIEQAITAAKKANPDVSESVYSFLKDVLLLDAPNDLEEHERAEWLDFVMRFQQITGPVMAKGLEDTAFYVYNRLVSLNEVGGDPASFGVSIDEFHAHNLARLNNWPHALIATSTHDSKRSEDVRARINVLSEMPDGWRKALARWSRINKKKRVELNGGSIPDFNEEYLLYQTLVGTWPAGDIREKGTAYDSYIDRITAYMLKACKEAKVNTNWVNPRIEYEEGFDRFVRSILQPDHGFVADFSIFMEGVIEAGMYNSLSQVVFKVTSPGIPDFYQGSEIWNDSLVDPDNRRPVDYRLRRTWLRELSTHAKESRLEELAGELVATRKDGRIKLYVTSRMLNFRLANRSLFEKGSYVPLAASGATEDNVCSFARIEGEYRVIVVVPRFLTRLTLNLEGLPFGPETWGSCFLPVPHEKKRRFTYRNVFTDELLSGCQHEGAHGFFVKDIFARFPVALLTKERPNDEKHS